jgi:glycosyltransferase involved in cell wall biosynthesis
LGVERALARFLTDRIIVISEQQRREICEEFRVGVPSQYRVIPLGIDFGEITRQSGFRAELGVGANTHLIATVGRLCPIKNQQLFLEATRRVIESARGTDVRFVLVGDGELRGDLEQAARALGISEHVTFTGFRRDASHLYSEIDVMVLTSRNEGTPVTLIEAMSAGVAVISTEVGGVVDLLGQRHDRRDGVTTWDHGLTVASEDAEALARAIGRLLDDPELRQQMAERGRAFVLSRLSKDRLISDISNLYGELVDAPPNAGKMIVPFDASRMREGKGPSAR